MYSASSSSCDCGDCWHDNNSAAIYYNNNYQCNWKNSMYPSVRQPMVYYAQIPLTRKQKNRNNEKKNPNCFVKAFRWYTEEHVNTPEIHCSKNNPDIIGFATWLDTKYEQFVQENRMEPTGYNLQLKSTSIIKTEKIHQEIREQHIVNKFPRLKSPWRKRKPNKEAGDVRAKSNQSLQYILHPKDLVLQDSECFQVSQASYNHANPVVSIEIQESRRLIVKSHSLTSVCEKTKNVNDLLLAIQEGAVKGIVLFDEKDNLRQKALKRNVSSDSLVRDLTKDSSCQCSEIIIKKIDTQTQYDDLQERTSKMSAHEMNLSTQPAVLPRTSCSKNCRKTETQTDNIVDIPKQETVKRIVQEIDRINVSCQCFEETLNIGVRDQVRASAKNTDNQKCEQPSTNFPFSQKTDPLILKQSATVTKTTNSFTILVNDTVQTSDYSIILEKDNGRDYPLFMRVIYADKLDGNITN